MTLKTWNYENRKVKELPSDVLQKHKYVQQILLANNRLRTLPNKIFCNLNKLTYLNLNCNCFSRIPHAIGNATSLEKLSFENNHIKRILKSDFEQNSNLKLLNLSENDLSFIAVDAFKNLIHLVELDLSFSSVGKLQWPIFQSNFSLQSLMIGDANLKIGHDLFKGLFNLVMLYLNNNNLSDTDLNVDVFCDLVNLKILDLSENHIQFLQKGLLDNNKRLTKIDLSDNFVDGIDPGFFDRNESLEYLSLQKCSPLLNIDFSLFSRSTYLSMLEISYCVQFPISEIDSLTYLKYDSICLSTKARKQYGIPEFLLSNSTNLQSLRINDSFISIETFQLINSQFQKLYNLNLTNCMLEDLRNYLFKDLFTLENLVFDKVPLKCFKHVLFQRNNKLKRLSLSNCSLTNIANYAFKNFPHLKTLNLSKNYFGNRLDSNIFINLVSLEKLDLSDTKLDALPETIFETNFKLNSLRLHHNPLNEINMKMFANNSILTFLSVSKTTRLHSDYSKDLKVLFVNC